MPAHKVKLTIEQGTTFGPVFRWLSGISAEDAQPVDLTGCSALMHVREVLDAPDTLLVLSTAAGSITLGADGAIQLSLTAVETAVLDWTDAVYDLEITFPDGTVVRRMQGTVRVLPEVTRD